MTKRYNIDKSIDPYAPYTSLPTFNGLLAVSKSSISDIDIFKDYVNLCGLKLIGDEDDYFMIEGDEEELDDFSRYWNY